MKSPAVMKSDKTDEVQRISTYYCLIYISLLILRPFYVFSVFFGLTKCDSPFTLTKGIGRFEEEASFSAPKAYMNTSRGRKRR